MARSLRLQLRRTPFAGRARRGRRGTGCRACRQSGTPVAGFRRGQPDPRPVPARRGAAALPAGASAIPPPRCRRSPSLLPIGQLQAMAGGGGNWEKTDLKIGFIAIITRATPLIMVDLLGFYKKQGLNVSLQKTAGGR